MVTNPLQRIGETRQNGTNAVGKTDIPVMTNTQNQVLMTHLDQKSFFYVQANLPAAGI